MSVYIAGSHQTDFARNWSREGLGLAELIAEAALGAIADAGLEPADVEVGQRGRARGACPGGDRRRRIPVAVHVQRAGR